MQGSKASCACGAAKFDISLAPLIRLFCHCSICQKFNQANYADVSVFRAKDVELPPPDSVEFETFRPPPAVQRGRCVACATPAIELVHLPPMPKLVIVPSANVQNGNLLPSPGFHMFYDSRVEDIDDRLPKYSGYLRSQSAFMLRLMKAMIRG